VPTWRGPSTELCKANSANWRTALEKCAEVWTLEHSRVQFTTMIIGSTSGGELPHADKPFPEDADRLRRSSHRPTDHAGSEGANPGGEAPQSLHGSRALKNPFWNRPFGAAISWDEMSRRPRTP